VRVASGEREGDSAKEREGESSKEREGCDGCRQQQFAVVPLMSLLFLPKFCCHHHFKKSWCKVAFRVAQGGVAVGGGLMGDGFAGSQRNRRLSDTKLSSPRPGSFVVVVIFRF